MTADEALGLALGQRLKADSAWQTAAKGRFFYFKAKTGTDFPYTTYVISSTLPGETMRTTAWWEFRVQMKHWCGAQDAAGNASAPTLARTLSDRALALFHCRDDAVLGTSAANIDTLNGLSLNGWQFMEAALVKSIPLYQDTIDDVGVWCLGHDFRFWLQAA